MRIFLLTLLLTTTLYAQTEFPGETPTKKESDFENAVEEARPVKQSQSEIPIPAKKNKTSADLRIEKHHTLAVGYELITSWIPSKKKISYTYFNNPQWSFELEYAYGSLSTGIVGIDLGRVTEKRTTLLAKRYFGNSFHLDFGPYYYDINARAGGKIMGVAQDTTIADFGVKGIGLATGLGNRWQWENGFTFGIDWLRLNIPLMVTEYNQRIIKNIPDEGKSDDVKNVIEYFSRIPTFAVFGLTIGYTF